MKVSGKPPVSNPWRRVRLWLLPALAVILLVHVYEPGFDRSAMHEALSDGRPDDALELLTLATNRHVLPELSGVNWWPAETRTRRIAMLSGDLARSAEDPGTPTIIAPRGRYRTPPSELRLAHAAPRSLQLQLHHRELGLPAASELWPAGRDTLSLELTLLPASTYDVVLSELDERAEDGAGPMVCLTDFTMLSEPEAHDVGILMQTAYDMAPDEQSAELLASLVAMHFGLYSEAGQRLAKLAERPGYEQLVRELRAIALARLDLDYSAVALLRG